MPRTILTYGGFIAACVIVVATFITATSYTQLAAASILYPALIIVAYKLLPIRPNWSSTKKVLKQPARVQPLHQNEPKAEQNAGISDLDKRTFLKLVGATGLSFFIISVFGRRVESLLFGQNTITPNNLATPPANRSIQAKSPTEGYKISEIDTGEIGYYGFTNTNGGWLIMKEDSNAGTFRYAKGLTNFPNNWRDRKNLKYDYFHNLSF